MTTEGCTVLNRVIIYIIFITYYILYHYVHRWPYIYIYDFISMPGMVRTINSMMYNIYNLYLILSTICTVRSLRQKVVFTNTADKLTYVFTALSYIFQRVFYDEMYRLVTFVLSAAVYIYLMSNRTLFRNFQFL